LKEKKEEFFEPSEFSLVLFAKSGKYITNKFEDSFTYSILNDGFNLDAGEYICLIDPIWKE
jgi:hypothetical protein